MKRKSIIVAVVVLVIASVGIFLVPRLISPRLVKISADAPFTLEVKRERSYFQAQKIQSRLATKGKQTYIMAVNDSAQGGQWFSIMVEATADTAVLDSLSAELKEDLQLDSIAVVNYNNANLEMASPDTLVLTEKKRIHENRPDIPEKAWDLIYHFPNTDLFYVQDFKLASFENVELATPKQIDGFLQGVDLPRGLSLSLFHARADAWAEAIYVDNLYGDRVTIDIIKLADTNPILSDSLVLSPEERPYEIASYFGQLILDTGDYATEEQSRQAIRTDSPLRGMRILIEPKKSYFRTYTILVDSTCSFVYFCQSTEKSEEELAAIMALIKVGNGMDEYDEFHNTFFTGPGDLPKNEQFVSFMLKKLDWSYAKNKDYAEWSKQMVGHWTGVTYYKNDSNNQVWSYSIFDLLTNEKLNTVYFGHYADGRDKDEEVDVYGTAGYFVSDEEVNFGFDRYVASVDDENSPELSKRQFLGILLRRLQEDGSGNLTAMMNLLENVDELYQTYVKKVGQNANLFSREDLVARANLLQFLPSGYQQAPAAVVAVDSASDSTLATKL